ncbi:hypothetical protein HY407_03020 [Candidatus Gottesmanbacteria bacterium]|nr:hypothetical protein [Candidatus Gottesmanbacteria bacterium]
MNIPFISKTKTITPSGPKTPGPSPHPSDDLKKSARKLAHGSLSIKDIIAPGLIEVDFDFLKIGTNYYKTLFVAGYPRFVSANWLYPLISYDHSLIISMITYPAESKVILEDLKRKIAEMEATIQTDIKRGKVIDPGVQVALDDALSLQAQLAKGAERFYQFGLYITIPAESLDELNQIAKEVESTLGSLLIVSKHATLQMEDGFKSSIPLGIDPLDVTRNMDTTSLATTFPFTTASLTANKGILYGINEHDGSLVIFDRFSLENANTVVFGKSGGGKSISYNTNVLIKREGITELVEVGKLINNLSKKHTFTVLEKNIEGVVNPNIQVFTFNHQHKGEWANVTIAARKKISKRDLLYRIVTKSGREITITKDHCTVLLRQGEIKSIKTKDIKVGDVVPLPRTVPQPLSPVSFIDISVLKKVIVKTKEKFRKKTKLTISSPLCRLLGYFISEGSYTHSSVAISGKNGWLLFDVKRAAKKIGLLTSYNHNKGKRVGIYIRPKYAKHLLEFLGCTKGAKTKRVPPIFFNLSNQRVADFLKAYFEGDGYVNEHSIGAISVSKNLISDICYLLYRFGIIARVRKTFKRATNSKHRGDFYWELTISGQSYLRIFKEQIGFMSRWKQKKLQLLLDKQSNTNVDVIPQLTNIFKEIYEIIYRDYKAKAPQILISLKNNEFSPSPVLLKKIIDLIEKRIQYIMDVYNQEITAKSPPFKPVIAAVLQTYKTINGETISLPTIMTTEQFANTPHTKFRQIRNAIIKLDQLKKIAHADLFWDPIVTIEKIKNREAYVYDLTVNNEVFLAGFGGMFIHNSFLVKLETLRSLMFGAEVFVIDPEGEYSTLCKAVSGEEVDFTFNTPIKMNPFDLSGIIEEGENELGLKILSLHALMRVVMGQLSPPEDALLDRALVLTYRQKGITPDPSTQKNEPPLMEDLYKALLGMEEPDAKRLAERLEKFVKGSLAGIFNQKSNFDIKNPLTVFNIKELEAELRPIAMFIILDFIWTKIKKTTKKRLLIIDEAWYLMKTPDSANFIYGIAKRARKYYLGLTTITQDVEDFLDTDHGKAIITNSSIQILLKQSTAAIDKLAQIFYLSGGEKHLLLSTEVGEGLFFAGSSHVAIRIIASPEEYPLVTSKPQEIIHEQEAISHLSNENKPMPMPAPAPPPPTPSTPSNSSNPSNPPVTPS